MSGIDSQVAVDPATKYLAFRLGAPLNLTEIGMSRVNWCLRGVESSKALAAKNCLDDAVIESFFGTLKAEYLHPAAPNGFNELDAGGRDYVHHYNHKRIKLLGPNPTNCWLRRTA